MPKQCVSVDLPDAISLAMVWIEGGDPSEIVAHADLHIKDIAQYAPHHSLISWIEKLKERAESYIEFSSRAQKKFRRKAA